MNIKQTPINKLNPAEYNPRDLLQEGDPEFEALKNNILTFGFVQPIVVNTRTGNMVGGHQRLNVAKALNMKKVPVTEVDLSLEDEKRLNLSLNKISGHWNEDKLGALLNDLKIAGEDLTLTGFNEFEIEELTLAFADVDLNAQFEEYTSTDTFTPEDENEPEFDEYESPEDRSKGTDREAVVKYEIIFDDETQQAVFHEFLKKLKSDFDNDAFPTHASRIHAYLKREVFK